MDNQKEFVCKLVGDERYRETQQAREILNKAEVPYKFEHEWNGGRYGLHLYSGWIFNLHMGLEQIARFASRYKRRHSPVESV